MAIQVSGTEVISNARALNNIASVDATTVATLNAGGVGGGGIDGIYTGWTSIFNNSAANRAVDGIGVNGNTVITCSTAGWINRSTDGGLTWVETQPNIGTSNSWNWYGVLYNPDLSQWLLWNNYGNIIYSNNDGASWAAGLTTNTQSNIIFQIIWSGSNYVAAARGGSYTSSNGTSWAGKYTYGVYNSYNTSIAYDGTTYVMFYSDNAASLYEILSSTNGSSWTSRRSGSYGSNTHMYGDVIYFNGAFRYTDFNKILQTSTNGTSWTNTGILFPYGFNKHSMMDGTTLVIPASQGKVGYSSDGVNLITAVFPTEIGAYAYSTTRRFLGGINGSVWISKV